MGLDRRLAEVHVSGDLGVAVPAGDLAEHFDLARRELGELSGRLRAGRVRRGKALDQPAGDRWIELRVPLAGRAHEREQALAAGRAPRTGRGYLAHRLLGRLALPRPLTIGLASPFARPARMAATLAAVVLGVTPVTFAVGLVTSLGRAVADLNLTNTEQVQVYYARSGPSGPKRPGRGRLPSPQPQRVVATVLGSLPGTPHYVLEDDNQYVRVSRLVQPIPVTAFQGYAGWTGYAMSSGHWYTGPGQVVVPKRWLTALHSKVGDTVTITGVGGRATPVRIVGRCSTHSTTASRC